MGRRVVVRALLDTHTFLWWIAESGRLSGKAHSAIAYESNDIIVSAATSWEIATKYRLGKLPGGEAVATDISGHIVGQGFEEIAISVAGAERVGRLPGPHRDSFNRMLIAQALAQNLTVLSVDEVFDLYGVNRLW